MTGWLYKILICICILIVCNGKINAQADSLHLEQRLAELANQDCSLYEDNTQYGLGYNSSCGGYIKTPCPFCNKDVFIHSGTNTDMVRCKDIVDKIHGKGYDVRLDCSNLSDTVMCVEYVPADTQDSFTYRKHYEPVSRIDMIFGVRYSPNSAYHSLKVSDVNDFYLLEAFFDGRDYYGGGEYVRVFLHEKIKRLQKLTNLGKNLQYHNHYTHIGIKDSKYYRHLTEDRFIELMKADGYTQEMIDGEIKRQDKEQ